MPPTHLACVLALAAACAAEKGDGGYSESGTAVVEVTPESLPTLIAAHPVVLVNFFEEGCTDCESAKLTANFARAAAKLKPEGIVLGQVACPKGGTSPTGSAALDTTLDELGLLYEWKPVIKLFRHGRDAGEYQPGHPWNETSTLTDIVSFGRRQLESSCDEVEDEDELSSFLEEDQVVLVGFYGQSDRADRAEGDPSQGPAAAGRGRRALCMDVAARLNGQEVVLPIAIATSDALRQKVLGATVGSGDAQPTIVAFTRFSQHAAGAADKAEDSETASKAGAPASAVVSKNYTLTGEAALDADQIRAFALRHHLPLVSTFTSETSPLLFKSPLKKHVLLVTTSNDPDLPDQREVLEAVATKHAGKAVFVVMHADRQDTKEAVKYLKLEPDELPTLLVYDWERMHTGSKYWFKRSRITERTVMKFADDYFGGQLKPKIKHRGVPPARNGAKRAVVDVTGENFRDVVLAPGKDVLVELFDGSGYVKPWPPTYWAPYEQLARRLAADKKGLGRHVVVARMDYYNNEMDDGDAPASAGLPRWKLFPAHDKLRPAGKRPAEGDGVTLPLRMRSYVGPRSIAGWTKFLMAHAQGGDATPAKKIAGKAPAGKDEL